MSETQFIDRRLYQPGETIVEADQPARTAYYIESGEVAIVIGRGRNRHQIGNLGPGELFGEMALIDGAPRSATVIALEPTTCQLINRAMVERLLERTDPGIRALLRVIIDRLREANQQLAEPRAGTG